MGIYIKGMEMPKDGCHHMICIYADGTVSTGGRVYVAVPVPPHGDLIDRDAAYDKIAEQEGGYYMDMDGVGMGLSETPVIIPAEPPKGGSMSGPTIYERQILTNQAVIMGALAELMPNEGADQLLENMYVSAMRTMKILDEADKEKEA